MIKRITILLLACFGFFIQGMEKSDLSKAVLINDLNTILCIYFMKDNKQNLFRVEDNKMFSLHLDGTLYHVYIQGSYIGSLQHTSGTYIFTRCLDSQRAIGLIPFAEIRYSAHENGNEHCRCAKIYTNKSRTIISSCWETSDHGFSMSLPLDLERDDINLFFTNLPMIYLCKKSVKGEV
jgi:hypothetical protein